MIQKFQNHTITPQHPTAEQEDFHFGSNPTMFTMMNNSFIDTTVQQQQQQQQHHHHHHFMHRR
jgi:hypothetical protein